jgi:hypothetical protein
MKGDKVMKMLPQESLFGAPHSNPTTSKDAAQAIKPSLPRLERRVWDCVVKMQGIGHGGATAAEVQHELALGAPTVTARIRALVVRGLLEASGATRETPSGRRAIVWRTSANPPQVHPSRGRSANIIRRERTIKAKLVETLRGLEWLKVPGVPLTACPLCGNYRDHGHAPGCRLAAALAIADAR